jgi:TrmH family RNA methyltransferase
MDRRSQNPLIINSVQNDRIKQVLKLRDRRARDISHHFLIEGYRELLRAFGAGTRIVELYYCASFFLGSNEQSLIEGILEKNPQCKLISCSEAVFSKISYRDRPDGLLAVAMQCLKGIEELILSPAPFLVAAEAIEKPGNLGTILRSSDSAGVHGLIVCDKCTDIFNPNTVRASVGTLFTVPVAEASTTETIAWLKKQNIAILAATPHGTVDYFDVDLTQGICIAVGTEQLGLSKEWMEAATYQVKIPMLGEADSLNVAMATTLLLYEVVRQRR